MNCIVAVPEGDSLVVLASSQCLPRAAGTAALQMDRSFDSERLGANGANCAGRESSRDRARNPEIRITRSHLSHLINTERVPAKPSSTLQRRRDGGVTNGASGCRLWRGANSGVGDAELFEVGFVFGWVEVELFEVGDEFLHFFFVELDGGLVGWRKE